MISARDRDCEESGRNRCQQLWASKKCRNACHNSAIRKFIRVRKYLNIYNKVIIADKDANFELENTYVSSEKIKSMISLNTQLDIHEGDVQSNNPNNDTNMIQIRESIVD